MAYASPMQIATILDAFIRKSFQVRPDDIHFGSEIDLWEEGYIDSLGVVELVHFIERTFEVSVPAEMLFEPDFVRISGMARLICRLAQDSVVEPTPQDADSAQPAAAAQSDLEWMPTR